MMLRKKMKIKKKDYKILKRKLLAAEYNRKELYELLDILKPITINLKNGGDISSAVENMEPYHWNLLVTFLLKPRVSLQFYQEYWSLNSVNPT
jgi:hypothetical protein